jgi:hypothetical protein
MILHCRSAEVTHTVAVAVALLGHTETLVAEHGANLLTTLCGAPPYSLYRPICMI